MSNLLDEAIIDAKALREAALKNAETIVIEKYSTEVKKTLEELLEQDDTLAALGIEGGEDAAAAPAADAGAADLEAAMGAEGAPAEGEEAAAEQDTELAPDIPLAATDDFADLDGKNLNSFLNSGAETELNIDLGALEESLKTLSESTEDAEVEVSLEELLSSDELNEEEIEELAQAKQSKARRQRHKRTPVPDDDEETDVNEELDADSLVDAIMEKLTVDMGADLAGWAGRSSDDTKYQIEKELAHRRSTDVEEELEALKKAQEELVFENRQLNEQNQKYEQAFQELKENLQDVNLSNARLLYTNRVLRNSSLNERQKDKIVEAISSAGSVTEAKTIYDTLQSTVESTPKKSPKSLSEAIGRRNTVLRATRKEMPASDPLQDRMKRLAGIK
tara:strand:- start:1122 stop:2297 length:1176 start_codon:yes stop_codon:yes gene_type:complete